MRLGLLPFCAAASFCQRIHNTFTFHLASQLFNLLSRFPHQPQPVFWADNFNETDVDILYTQACSVVQQEPKKAEEYFQRILQVLALSASTHGACEP